jgi:hypothetical protein
MRDRALWLLIPTSPPLVLGIVGVVALIAAGTLAVYAGRRVAPEVSLGVAFLPGVLVGRTVWGLAPGAATAVLEAAAFDSCTSGSRAACEREGMGSFLAR